MAVEFIFTKVNSQAKSIRRGLVAQRIEQVPSKDEI